MIESTQDWLLDKNEKFIFLDKGKQNDRFNLEMQQKHEDLTGERINLYRKFSKNS